MTAKEINPNEWEMDGKILTTDQLHKLILLMPDDQVKIFFTSSKEPKPWENEGTVHIDFNLAK